MWIIDCAAEGCDYVFEVDFQDVGSTRRCPKCGRGGVVNYAESYCEEDATECVWFFLEEDGDGGR